MKRYLRPFISLLILILLIGLSAPAFASPPDSIPWTKMLTIPVESEIRAFRGSMRAPYICCEPEFSGVKTYVEYAVDFRADYAPPGTYLCVSNWSFDDSSLLKRFASVRRDYDGVAGYCGFQKRHDNGQSQIILTVWDTYCYDKYGNMTDIQATQVYPANNKGFEICKQDLVTGEGCFVHTILPYDWQEGKNYRALLQLTNPSDGSSSHLLFYVCDLQTGIWTQLVEYDLGYSGVYMNWGLSFLEDYSSGGAGQLRSAALSNYRVHPSNSSEWTSAKSAKFSCYYSNGGSYSYGARGNAFWTITTGLSNLWPTPENYKKFSVDSCEKGSPY